MEPIMIRQKDLPMLSGMPLSVTLAVLEKAKIQPVHMGRGRGKGLFWNVDAVKIAIRQLHADAQQQSKAPKKKTVFKPVLDLPLDVLLAELKAGRKQPMQ